MANVTKREWLGIIREIVEQSEHPQKEGIIKEYIEKALTSLDRKANSATNAKKKAETEKQKNEIFNALGEMEEPVTVTEFLKASGLEYTNQKVSYLLRLLVEENVVVKTAGKATIDENNNVTYADKKSSYYAVVTN